MKRKHSWITKICIICKKEFKVRWARRDSAKFCSLKCRGKAQSVGQWKEWSKASPATVTKLICQICGRSFIVKNRKKFYRPHKYCSKDCYTKAQKTGQYKRSRNLESNMRRKKEDEKCLICSFDRFIEICHLTPPNKGGTFEESNILFLCPNHHRLLDNGLLNKEEQQKIGRDKLSRHYSAHSHKQFYN